MKSAEVGKIEVPVPRNAEKLIFAEGINYFAVGSESIWGEEGPNTLKFMDNARIKGIWLNLAAGDGRYCKRILQEADRLVAADIDPGALSKTWHRMLEIDRSRLDLVVLDLTQTWPFADNSFNGVFSTGNLHFFSKQVLSGVFREMDRVLLPGGKIVMNFGTNIKRVMPNGELLIHPNEPQHRLEDAKEFIAESFRGFHTKFFIEPPEPIPYMNANPPFTYSSSIILMLAEKF